MSLVLSPHPAAHDALAVVRRRDTAVGEYRTQLHRIAVLLVTAATTDLPSVEKFVETPVARAAVAVATPPVFVPILRAGASLLPGALAVWPDAPVGFIGAARDRRTLVSNIYLDRPGALQGRDVVVLEPMLATGGSLAAALDAIDRAGPPRSVRVVGVICTPEGVEVVCAAHPEAVLHFVAEDPELDRFGVIRPGLGDAGDRAWGE